MKKGVFITFEGAEGSGKSTQIRRACRYLKKHGRRVVLLREPGTTRVSEAVRAILLDRRFRGMTAEAELLLYLAARAQIVGKILPALRQGKTVICDRFEDSTLAYQGFGRGLSVPAILAVSRRFVRGALKPDLTFLLDIPPAAGLARTGRRRDRMESEALAFHRRVRAGFLALARREPRRFAVIDARAPIAAVAAAVEKRLKHVLR
jgi:dTMP kinase